MDEVRTTHVYVGDSAVNAARELEIEAARISRAFACALLESGIVVKPWTPPDTAQSGRSDG